MLIVTRKKGESIIISDNIKITIVDIKGDSIRIGVEAPKEVKILREEIYAEIARENAKALILNATQLNKMKNILPKNSPKG